MKQKILFASSVPDHQQSLILLTIPNFIATLLDRENVTGIVSYYFFKSEFQCVATNIKNSIVVFSFLTLRCRITDRDPFYFFRKI